MTEFLLPMDFADEDQNITSDDFYTPPHIFQSLGLDFDTDPCQPKGGVSWIPVKKYYTIETDGLAHDWIGRVWLNPPYSNPTPWIHRFIEHANGITLVQTSRARFFDKLWLTADGIVMTPYNFRFMTPSGVAAQIFMPTALFAYGADNVKALGNLGFGRVR